MLAASMVDFGQLDLQTAHETEIWCLHIKLGCHMHFKRSIVYLYLNAEFWEALHLALIIESIITLEEKIFHTAILRQKAERENCMLSDVQKFFDHRARISSYA